MSKHTDELRKPPHKADGDCYCNLDHTFEKGAEEKLRDGEVLQHSALDFCGTVWFADGQFHNEIWVYHSRVKVVSADTLPAVIEAVNEEFGYE